MSESEIHTRKRKARVPDGCSRSFNKERVVIKNLIGNFDARGSNGAKLIERIMGTSINDISQNNLNYLGEVIDLYIKKNFTRNHKRSKLLAVKWFDENYEIINSVLPRFDLFFSD